MTFCLFSETKIDATALAHLRDPRKHDNQLFHHHKYQNAVLTVLSGFAAFVCWNAPKLQDAVESKARETESACMAALTTKKIAYTDRPGAINVILPEFTYVSHGSRS